MIRIEEILHLGLFANKVVSLVSLSRTSAKIALEASERAKAASKTDHESSDESSGGGLLVDELRAALTLKRRS